jgi:hypothetical protein
MADSHKIQISCIAAVKECAIRVVFRREELSLFGSQSSVEGHSKRQQRPYCNTDDDDDVNIAAETEIGVILVMGCQWIQGRMWGP